MKKIRRYTLLIASMLMLFSGASNAATVSTHPDMQQPLEQRWQWGLDRAGEGESWLGYEFSTLVDERLRVGYAPQNGNYYRWGRGRVNLLWSGNWRNGSGSQWSRGLSIEAVLGGHTDEYLPYLQQRDFVVLVKLNSGTIEELYLTDPASPIFWQDIPLLWLGQGTLEESFELLSGTMNPLLGAPINRALIRAIGLHNSTSAAQYLQQQVNNQTWGKLHTGMVEALTYQSSAESDDYLLALAQDQSQAVSLRRIAISSLPRRQPEKILSALHQLTTPLNPSLVRKEALQALGDLRHPDSTSLLRDLITSDDNVEIVLEALDALGKTGNEFDFMVAVAQTHENVRVRIEALETFTRLDARSAFEPLTGIIAEDIQFRVRKAALEELDSVPESLAVPWLLSFANQQSGQPPQLREEAVEALSEFSPTAVKEGLNEIAWGDAIEGMRAEAIESLGRLKDAAANRMLLEIARSHPSSDSREEALDELQRRVL